MNDSEDNSDDEIEKRIFSQNEMSDIDKMTNFIDNKLEGKNNNNDISRNSIKDTSMDNKVSSNIKTDNKKNINNISNISTKNKGTKKELTDFIPGVSLNSSNAKINSTNNNHTSNISINSNNKNTQKVSDVNPSAQPDYSSGSSDDEEAYLNEEVDSFTDKTELLKMIFLLRDKLKEKKNQTDILRNQLEKSKKGQNKVLESVVESIKNRSDGDIREKKLIELVRKNQDLNLKIEKFKLEASSYKKQYDELNKKHREYVENIENIQKENNIPVDKLELNSLKKKVKLNEKHLADIRNKLQLTKEENVKLNILIKREVGEAFDVNKALVDKNYFKPRAEIIESLKGKIKTLTKQLQIYSPANNNVNNQNSNMQNSNASFNTNISGTQNSSNPPLLYSLPPCSTNMVSFSQYKKERESLLGVIEENKKNINEIKEENQRLKLRKIVLEKEIKMQKNDFKEKLKILIEKSDNDEKLINAMKNELMKKGGSSSNIFYDEANFNLKQEITKLKDQLKEKNDYINKMNALLIPEQTKNDSNRNNISEMDRDMLDSIMQRVNLLERENKQLKEQLISNNKTTSKYNNKHDNNKKKNVDDDDDDTSISETLARENAKLRMKIADLEQRLNIS